MNESDKCTSCGADLTTEPVPSVLGGFDVVCAFCGHRHHIPAEQPRPVDRQAPPAATPGGARRRLLSLAGLAAAGVCVGVILSHKNPAYWDEVGGDPIVTTIAGREAIVGRLRNVGGDNQLFVGAFDSSTQAQRWKAGPYGTYSEGYRNTHFAVVGSHVVVTDFHAKVHVLDLQTGKEQRVISLSDKVESQIDGQLRTDRNLCAADADHVWMQQIDKRTVLLDLASGSVTEAPRPNACNVGFIDMPSMYPGAYRHELGVSTQWNKPNFTAASIPLDASSVFVVLGTKTPGTPTPMVMGVDKKDRAVRWEVPLPAVDLATVREAMVTPKNAAACEDRFIGTYGVGQNSWHVTALDATNGVRQWDVVLKPIFSVDELQGVVCSATRVYVVRMMSVDVLDAATGKAIGTIGTETYR